MVGVTTGHSRSRTLPLSGRERGSGNMDGDLGSGAVKFEHSNSALPVNPFKINGSSVRFFGYHRDTSCRNITGNKLEILVTVKFFFALNILNIE